MKKILISRIYSVLSATVVFSLITLQSSGQDLTASIGSPAKVHAGASISAKTPAAVNAKVMNSFKRSFASVQNPFWEVSNNNYYAHFQSDDRQALVAFRKNGRIAYSVLYGVEKHLPAHEKSLVQENYPGYMITATQYVVKNNVNTWLVTLESNRDIYKVKVKDDDVNVVERIKKVR
jgi:hypothetical protein